MLWLAVHLPSLPLDLAGDVAGADALAIEEPQGQVRRIVACNDTARAAGVRAGQPLAAALALCGTLRTLQRKPHDERAALERLATWALGYTSQVGVWAPDGLLLEIAASQRLFGGLVPLARRIADALTELGYAARLAVAPTPAGARLLARTGARRIVRGLPALTEAVGPLPFELAELPVETIEGLAGIGARTFEAVLRLPRAELARRFGHALTGYLDRVLGHRPEPVTPFHAPEQFRAGLELPYPVEHTEGLQFPLKRLLRELAAWLLVRQVALLRGAIVLRHEDHPPTEMTLGLCQASGDPEHLFGLARTQLERTQLPAPVQVLAVEARECVALAGVNRDLFARAHEREDIARAIERVGSRLGAGAVRRLTLVADHRPERAARVAEIEMGSEYISRRGGTSSNHAAGKCTLTPFPFPPRPLLLLDPPQPLAWWLVDVGSATSFEGPERIEAGWWDEVPVARDYYRLRTGQGLELWVYRERAAPAGWYVHGLYA